MHRSFKGDSTPSQTTDTLVEQICTLSKHAVNRNRTANQGCTRFIATDVRDYTEQAPAVDNSNS